MGGKEDNLSEKLARFWRTLFLTETGRPKSTVLLYSFLLSLVFLAIGVAAVAFAVGVFMSAFVGFNVVADMLLLIGAGASIFAVAMVLLWFGIWFLTKVCFGWVRLIHRGGVRFSRKEVQAA